VSLELTTLSILSLFLEGFLVCEWRRTKHVRMILFFNVVFLVGEGAASPGGGPTPRPIVEDHHLTGPSPHPKPWAASLPWDLAAPQWRCSELVRMGRHLGYLVSQSPAVLK